MDEELFISYSDSQNRNANYSLSTYQIFMRLLYYNRPKIFIVILFFGWIIVAIGLPIASIYIMKWSFSYISFDSSFIKTKMATYCLILFGIGWVIFASQAITRCILQILSLSMTNLIRKDIYNALLNQPIEFYDKNENSTGQLTGILATDSRVI